ncbi:sensor histidine kinase [Jeotgalibacillus proteolyticus]|uniref:histidine kinase n=1 Tax=Jeotgalibacillus proteolyticus TaxID=2082395 RepID=A0A2S5G8U1_9BACL|nr:HAMP domain-containing sensor histidine kinase [Jeotgalibacillus proteolyticus]PPA69334.1 sensor histidine kinase [Jeotgalibacillus proteolyticus]
MSIRKRLLLSNLAMIVLPVIGLIIMEIILGFFMFGWMGLDPESRLKRFTQLRFGGIILILIVTNGVLTYYMSKTIIKPVRELTDAAKKLAGGERKFYIQTDRKDELGELAESFEEMRRRLFEAERIQQRYEEGRKELVASISHDLKTPLTSIKGYIEGIRDGVADTPEKLERYIETVYKKAGEMDHLIDELFLYSKLDVNRVPFYFEKVDLTAYLNDYLEELKLTSEVKTFFLSHGKPVMVLADREQLNRVFTNIINNSLKHMDKKEKELTIELNELDERIEVQIIDNGEGISEEDLPRIFEQFYQADSSRGKQGNGSGLGLAIARKIVEEHGSNIRAKSLEGEGTSVSFTLPLWKEGNQHGTSTNH